MPEMTHSDVLTALCAADADALRALAEDLLPDVGAIEVIESRTGMILLPLRDTVRGTDFHLGEVLVAQAHIRVGGVEGYGVIPGRNLEQAMAVAVVDLAWQRGGPARDRVATFAARAADEVAACDHETFRAVEATRVRMETF